MQRTGIRRNLYSRRLKSANSASSAVAVLDNPDWVASGPPRPASLISRIFPRRTATSFLLIPVQKFGVAFVVFALMVSPAFCASEGSVSETIQAPSQNKLGIGISGMFPTGVALRYYLSEHSDFEFSAGFQFADSSFIENSNHAVFKLSHHFAIPSLTFGALESRFTPIVLLGVGNGLAMSGSGAAAFFGTAGIGYRVGFKDLNIPLTMDADLSGVSGPGVVNGYTFLVNVSLNFAL